MPNAPSGHFTDLHKLPKRVLVVLHSTRKPRHVLFLSHPASIGTRKKPGGAAVLVPKEIYSTASAIFRWAEGDVVPFIPFIPPDSSLWQSRAVYSFVEKAHGVRSFIVALPPFFDFRERLYRFIASSPHP
jgi:hypothetical protein